MEQDIQKKNPAAHARQFRSHVPPPSPRDATKTFNVHNKESPKADVIVTSYSLITYMIGYHIGKTWANYSF